MTPYAIIRNNILPVISEDVFTIIGGEDRSWGIVEVDITGAGSTSNFTELGIYRVGTLGVTGTNAVAITPAINANHPAAIMTCFRTWATQPVVGVLLHPCPVNSNGNRHYWKATKLEEVLWFQGGAIAAATCSIRALTVNGNSTVKIKVIEI